jgi:hypothetical protein
VAVSGCKNKDTTVNEFTTWDQARVFTFLNEVLEYTRDIPLETESKEVIVKKYERYFTQDLSAKIVDSLYVKSDKGWYIPDGDAGYSFFVPSEPDVSIEFNKENIKVRETHEIGMYSLLEYTVIFDDKPIISDWIKK